MTSSKPVLLVVDDERAILDILGRFAVRHGFDVEQFSGGRPALEWLREHSADMALVDVRMPDVNGLDVLRTMREVAPDCVVVLMTGFAAVDSAVEAIKLGAADYLSKPIEYERLTSLLKMVREQTERRRSLSAFESGLARRFEFHGMVGRSAVMEELFTLIRRLAPHARAALVTGETGSGKELIARALHTLGPRSNRRFVIVNCSAVVPTLFESELFGHVRGAFTGATDSKAGLFEHADGGTLFLDEIGELPGSVQAKLLRALETGEIQRVGALDARRVDVNVIAATNRDLRAEIEAGQFRSDLYFRLNVVELRAPPLRDRREDIPYLAAAFREHFSNAFHKPISGVTPGAEQMLMRARWDGNVRELRNVIERACVLAEGAWITERDLGGIPGPRALANREGLQPQGQQPADDMISLDSVEREHIVGILERVKGNKSRAAEALGLDRRKLYRLLERHGLQQMVRRRQAPDAPDKRGDSQMPPTTGDPRPRENE